MRVDTDPVVYQNPIACHCARRAATAGGYRPPTVTSAAPLQFLILLVAGWIDRRQGAAIDYLRAENGVLRARLGPKRAPRFSDRSERSGPSAPAHARRRPARRQGRGRRREKRRCTPHDRRDEGAGRRSSHGCAERYLGGCVGGLGCTDSFLTQAERSKKRYSSAFSCGERSAALQDPGTSPEGAPPACRSVKTALPQYL